MAGATFAIRYRVQQLPPDAGPVIAGTDSDSPNEEVLHQAQRAASARRCRLVVVRARSSEAFLREAASIGAALIVLGPGRGAERVAQSTPLPLLIARPSPVGVVIGATDFSVGARTALVAAAREAAQRQAALHLLHVIDVRSYVLDRVAASALPYLKGRSAFSLEELEEVARLAQTRLRDAFRSVTTNGGEALVVRGYAVDSIVQTAERSRAELLVMGAYGCGSEDGPATFGRTVAEVIAAAPCSVLVVRETAARGSTISSMAQHATPAGMSLATQTDMNDDNHHRPSIAAAGRREGSTDAHEATEPPATPPVREEYPGPQETSTGERIDPGATAARPMTEDERRGGRQRGAS